MARNRENKTCTLVQGEVNALKIEQRKRSYNGLKVLHVHHGRAREHDSLRLIYIRYCPRFVIICR
jgi:hypothetical protein